MAGKSVDVRSGVIRTYSRLRPARKVQPQKWFSPAAERKHLFSSSCSSSNLSSSRETSSSADSDYLPPKRKASVACKKESLKPPSERRTLSKRKKKCLCLPKKNTRNSVSMSNSNSEEKENDARSERNQNPPFIFSTPFRRFVTIRRKAPGPAQTMKPQIEKSKSEALPIMSSDSLCDFETYDVTLRKKKRLCTDVTNILNSSVDTFHSPIPKSPLLSSTPSVLLTAMPRTENSFVRQLALCEPLEESVVKCCQTDFPCEVDVTGQITQLQSVDIISDKSSVTQTSSNINQKHTLESSVQSVHKKVIGNESRSGVKCVRIKMTHGTSKSPLRLLPPILVSSSDSHSVFCIDEEKLKSVYQKDDDGQCVFSSELFSSEDETQEKKEKSPAFQVNQKIKSRQQHNKTSVIGKLQILMESPSAWHVDKWKYFNRKKFQPVVRLNSKVVTEYFQKKNRTTSKNLANNKKDVYQKESDDHSAIEPSHIHNVGSIVLPMKDGCLGKMQPVVCLQPTSLSKCYLKNKSKTRDVDGIDPVSTNDGSGVRFHSPAFHTKTGTPLIPASIVKSKMQNSFAPQEATGTGRKVCISGFSAQRWGTRKKIPTKTQQQLSFQDGNDLSLLRFKEDGSVCGALSSSLLFSSSLLTSSFMNSTPVKNLNLSTESLTTRNPQKEHQRWARLRAALSLHRKKKVEAGPSDYRADRRNGKISLTSRNSSLLLLSPFQSSLCSDELTDGEKVLVECQQDNPIAFYQCLSQDQLRRCQKVGEGVYGEVFRALRGEQHVALKVIPIEGSQKINGEHQKSFAEILPEIIISKELSLLGGGAENRTSGFIKLHSAHCVRGSYPTELLSAWDIYAEDKGTENERPAMFGSEQLFMILEFEFGGEDLERMSSKLPSVAISRSILHQVTAALAVAEEELRFEHRDLHWGNLLLEKSISCTLSASLHGETFNIPSAGIQVKIIDYTLSRLDKDGLTVFCDLSTDEELFLGEGDLQFDVYRSTRQENQNNWSSYRPHSNVLWLHYLCDKLLQEVQYVKKPTSVSHRRELRKLRDFRRDVLQFSSATDVLQRCKLFK
ncbi:serine/threonine-protein kinase haspin isoform X2 [Mixophyes fleayi]|uniref:serine/threonine-protein kinase haspin isoform X2 n=1 Tax=Mixophyes fleayi TaxID=3061075 RepID=UPI003F4D8B8E